MGLRGWRLAGIVFALSATVLLGHERILFAIGDYLVIQDKLEPADVIHVISGGDYRTDYAVQLYRQGYSKRVFFTGGWCVYYHYYHGQHSTERAEAQGIAKENIAVDESQVTSTFAEAVLVKELIVRGPTPIRSVIVVSDPYHMRRVRWTYKRVLGDSVRVELAPVPFSQTPYQRRWWNDPASRRYVVNEYVKSIYYLARYQLGWEGLAALDRE
jgi:uncharacterized SAM-binding protein YcdF (DUF218 family)